jgi:hypothetical protein
MSIQNNNLDLPPIDPLPRETPPGQEKEVPKIKPADLGLKAFKPKTAEELAKAKNIEELERREKGDTDSWLKGTLEGLGISSSKPGNLNTPEAKEKTEKDPLANLQKLLAGRNIPSSKTQTAEKVTLSVIIPGKQKQFDIAHDGQVFKISEKRTAKQDEKQNTETQYRFPQEVLSHIEKAIR